MNLEQIKNQKNNQIIEDLDFDFKPITSGLGFHHQKATEIKPVMTERIVAVSPLSQPHSPLKKDMNVYQNDLSLFYGQNNSQVAELNIPELKIPEQKYFRLATKPQRVFAYLTDLFFIGSILGIVLTVMARTISMDLLDVWSQYPNEITPLVLTLFCGFYLIYFSIFEKTNQSTLGKNLFGLRVVTKNDSLLSLASLLLRSIISLLNFVSLGLFSYFDLQSKITDSKVIRID
jgi:uncharacterized RDD family membrane protein YckC